MIWWCTHLNFIIWEAGTEREGGEERAGKKEERGRGREETARARARAQAQAGRMMLSPRSFHSLVQKNEQMKHIEFLQKSNTL